MPTCSSDWQAVPTHTCNGVETWGAANMCGEDVWDAAWDAVSALTLLQEN